MLDRAYTYCDSITAAHSRSFYLATALLPADKRRTIRALYAFCHVSDNLVDCPERDAEKALAAWRGKALSPEPPMSDLVAMAWADVRRRYRIPQRYAEQLLDSVARDLRQKRYATFESLVVSQDN